MKYTDKLVLVCSHSDSKRAAYHGLPMLQLCIGMAENGTLRRFFLPANNEGHILGISDMGVKTTPHKSCALNCISEVKRCKMQGIFADFEHDSAAAAAFLHMLDEFCFKEGIPLYVPILSAKYAPHSIIVTESAISGGSLDEYILSTEKEYKNRLAVSIRPVCTDFILPANDSEGTPISHQKCNELMHNYGSQAFFSYELCAKYFTYMDDDKNAHFVLFDDANTILSKLERLNSLPVKCIFALYPDVMQII